MDGTPANFLLVRRSKLSAKLVWKVSGWHRERVMGKLLKRLDSKSCFTAVCEESKPAKWNLYQILGQIRDLEASFSALRWSWVPREANHAADRVAMLAGWGLCAEDCLTLSYQPNFKKPELSAGNQQSVEKFKLCIGSKLHQRWRPEGSILVEEDCIYSIQ